MLFNNKQQHDFKRQQRNTRCCELQLNDATFNLPYSYLRILVYCKPYIYNGLKCALLAMRQRSSYAMFAPALGNIKSVSRPYQLIWRAGIFRRVGLDSTPQLLVILIITSVKPMSLHVAWQRYALEITLSVLIEGFEVGIVCISLVAFVEITFKSNAVL